MNTGLPDCVYFHIHPNIPLEKTAELLVYNPLSKLEIIKKTALEILKNPLPWISIGLTAVSITLGVLPPISLVVCGVVLLIFIALKINYGSASLKSVLGLIIGNRGNCLPLAYSAKTTLFQRHNLLDFFPQKKTSLENREQFVEYTDITNSNNIIDPLLQGPVQDAIEYMANKEHNRGIPLLCPYTKNPMLFPVKLYNSQKSTLCDISALTAETIKQPYSGESKKLTFEVDTDAWKANVEAIGRLFIFLNDMFEKHLSIANISDYEELKMRMRDAIGEEKTLFQDSNALLEKLKDPTQITADQACAIAYHIFSVFDPILEFPDKIAEYVKNTLDEKSVVIKASEKLRNQKKKEIEKWSRDLKDRLIPQSCHVIRRIRKFN